MKSKLFFCMMLLFAALFTGFAQSPPDTPTEYAAQAQKAAVAQAQEGYMLPSGVRAATPALPFRITDAQPVDAVGQVSKTIAAPQSGTTVLYAQTDSGGLGQWLQNNWGKALLLLITLFEVIVRLTPSDKDNSIFVLIKGILDKLVPNQKTGGGTFT